MAATDASAPTTLPTAAAPQVENYGKWSDPAAWWSASRWTIGAASQRTWFMWGVMMQDSRDMQQHVVPVLNGMADHWDQLGTDLDKSILSAQKTLDQAQSVNAGFSQSALTVSGAKTVNSMKNRREMIRNNGSALRDAADTISRGAAAVIAMDPKYQKDLANLNACTADAQAVMPGLASAATAMLRAGNQIQMSMGTEQEMAKAKFEQLPLATIPNSDPTAKAASLPTPATPGVVLQHQAAGTSTTAPSAANGLTSASPGLATPGLATPGVTLAGTGAAGTLAPPTPGSFGTFNPGPSVASASPVVTPVTPGFGLAAGGVAGTPGATSGLAPFIPMTGGAAAVGGAGGADSQRAGRRPARRPQDAESGSGSAATSASSQGAMPMIPPTGMGAFGASARPKIRPGVAKRVSGPAKPTGVPAGLLGRGAPADADADSAAAAQRRASSTRRRRADANTVEFLDEEAWQAEDPGRGLVATPEEVQPTAKIPGPLLHG